MSSFSCPPGMVIPDNPERTGVIYPNITSSNCALSCVDPVVYPTEVLRMNRFAVMMSCLFTATVCAVVVILWIRNERKRKQYFIMSYGTCLTVSLSVVAFLNIADFTPSRYCYDNASPHIGLAEPSAVAVEAFMLHHASLFVCWCFCLQSHELFVRVVYEKTFYRATRRHYLMLFGIPMCCALALTLSGAYSCPYGLGICTLLGNKPTEEMIFFALPSGVALLLGNIFSVSIWVKLVMLQIYTPGEQVVSLRMHATVLKFIFFIGVFLTVTTLITLNLGEALEGAEDGYQEWGRCVFQHYDDVSKDSFASICGRTAASPMSPVELFKQTTLPLLLIGLFFVFVNIEGVVALLRKSCSRSAQVGPSRYLHVDMDDLGSIHSPGPSSSYPPDLQPPIVMKCSGNVIPNAIPTPAATDRNTSEDIPGAAGVFRMIASRSSYEVDLISDVDCPS